MYSLLQLVGPGTLACQWSKTANSVARVDMTGRVVALYADIANAIAPFTLGAVFAKPSIFTGAVTFSGFAKPKTWKVMLSKSCGKSEGPSSTTSWLTPTLGLEGLAGSIGIGTAFCRPSTLGSVKPR